MKTIYAKIAVLLALCLLFPCALTGCKPSKKKVTSSSYYKELKDKYKKLKKENKELKEELKEKDALSEDETRAADYLEKIGRDRIISLEVGYADNMEGSELIRDERVFPIATAIAKRADLTGKYTPDQIADKYGPGYEYILYDEDNAVYEILVYGGNYVVFTDLPNNVYYAYDASALGDAFMHYRDGYPNSKPLHRLADSPLVTDDHNCYENDSAFRAANFIRTMDKTQISRKKADHAWLKAYLEKQEKDENKSDGEDSQEDRTENSDGESQEDGTENSEVEDNDQEETGQEDLDARIDAMIEEGDPDRSVYEPEGDVYTFYHHGNTMLLTLYDQYICIENMDQKRTWYQVSPEEIKELKKQFVVAKEESVSNQKTGKEDSGESQSHEKEIEEESDVSSTDN
ncbi:MAG: hypothetical protein IJ137_04265 [Eubacterium sp.]|nr:hypothetical protein [Eubacterium sp.]